MHFWKFPQLIKGALSFLPMLDAWRLARAATGGSGSARYCYSVWLRHLTLLGEHGFHLKDARVGELGPGDSVGTGIVALLSGAKSYVALDLPFLANADLNVLEHVDALDETYFAMSEWLSDGGYASHVIDFGAHHLSPDWNGHWAFDDFAWRIVRGRREFLLNREPLSRHLQCAERSGFEVLYSHKTFDDNGLPNSALARQFRGRSDEDRRTRGVVLVLKKNARNLL